MARVKRGVTTRAKHKNILEQAKGYYGRRKNTIRIARQAVEKAGQYAYRDRKVKKRTFRGLWIQRINAGVRAEGLTYSQFMHGLKLAGVELDRKVLADIAMHEEAVFTAIIAQAKAGSAPGRLKRPVASEKAGRRWQHRRPFRIGRTMTDENDVHPEVLESALNAARTVSEQMPAIQAALKAAQQSAIVEQIKALMAATNWQAEIARIARDISFPLEQVRSSIETALAPPSDLSTRIVESLSVFSANTAALQAVSQSNRQLQDTVAALTGKSSEYQALVRTLGKNRDRVGVHSLQVANQSKDIIQDEFAKRKGDLEQAALDARLASETLDLTLPVDAAPAGTIHPVSQVMDELAEIFADLGFAVATGPEIEDDWHNFTALNIPETHPARAMHDTFYFSPSPPRGEGGRAEGEVGRGGVDAPDTAPLPDPLPGGEREQKKMLLRTHTSPVQIRTMLNQPPPIRIIAPGRTYRSDSDATHTPMFHQVEGLVIDRGITLAHLKWTLETFLKAYFERDDIVLRLRPSYFPFTEPSVEIDVGYTLVKGKRIIGGGGDDKGGGWLEVLGSGMVHPKVIAACGLDPAEWQGFAFGCGIDRLAMLKYGMDDLRAFFDGDIRWLKHYGFAALDVPTLSGGVGA